MNDLTEEKTCGKRASLAFLGGGKSRRYGKDKSLERRNGQTIIEMLHGRFGDLFQETLVVSDRAGKFHFSGIREITDLFPNRGPLGGLHAALRNVRTEYLMLLACDIPTVTRDVVLQLLRAAEQEECQAVVPVHESGFEPMCAVFRKSVLPCAEQLLRTGSDRVGLLELFEQIDLHYVETENCFTNLNTKEDADLFFRGQLPDNRTRKGRYLAFVKENT